MTVCRGYGYWMSPLHFSPMYPGGRGGHTVVCAWALSRSPARRSDPVNPYIHLYLHVPTAHCAHEAVCALSFGTGPGVLDARDGAWAATRHTFL
eukprot:scaffold4408_cov143-Isochrysis_galbana.AAC.2